MWQLSRKWQLLLLFQNTESAGRLPPEGFPLLKILYEKGASSGLIYTTKWCLGMDAYLLR